MIYSQDGSCWSDDPILLQFHNSEPDGMEAICIKDNPPMTGFGRHLKIGEKVRIKGVVSNSTTFEVCVPSECAFYQYDYFSPFDPDPSFGQSPAPSEYDREIEGRKAHIMNLDQICAQSAPPSPPAPLVRWLGWDSMQYLDRCGFLGRFPKWAGDDRRFGHSYAHDATGRFLGVFREVRA
jgi:hypothetical protein